MIIKLNNEHFILINWVILYALITELNWFYFI